MADQADTDVLMQFINMDGTPVWAECSMIIPDSDTLINGDFYASPDLHEYSNYFEISSFNFDLNVKDKDGNSTPGAPGGTPGRPGAPPMAGQRGSIGGQGANGPAGAGGAQAGKKKEGGEFASWRSAKDEDLKKLAATYTPEFKIVQFTKVIDAASPALFEACVNARKFKLVTVVKRLPQGGSMGLSLNIGLSGISLGVTSTANPIFAFLRLDFSNALITSISWSDGDLVKENITFECRSVKMKYRPQNNDGSIQSSGQVNIEYVQPLEDPPPR